jgi:hypothetical protein
MTKEQLDEVLERVRSWPKARQEDAVNMLLAMEAMGTEPYALSADERAAVRRGLEEMRQCKFASDEEL